MAAIEQTDLGGSFNVVSRVLSNESYDQDRGIYIDAEDLARAYTASEARTSVRKLIAGLKAAGLNKGDCVCVHAFNDVDVAQVIYPLLFLAIVGAGGVYTGSNPAYTPTEMIRQIQCTDTRFLISDSDALAKVSMTAFENVLPASRIFQINAKGQQALPDFATWETLSGHGEGDCAKISSIEEAKGTTAALLSTSGTSGLPKFAMISHYNLTAQMDMLNDKDRKPYTGVATYVMRRFDLEKFLACIRTHEITETTVVPTIIVTILKRTCTAYEDLRSLRTVWCAGSPLVQITQNEMFRLLRPTARLIQCWGMTEAGWITTFLWPEKDHSGSVGRLLPGMEAKLIQDGETVKEDLVRGEIYIRGPVIMQGYKDDPEATAATIDEDGWLCTGDVAYVEHGKIYIVDRKKELIKVRGWQISPAELEAQLILHPSIKEAAVIGVSSVEGDTELPRAYVVQVSGAHVTEEEIKTFMSLDLAKFKALTGGVIFVDALPRNAMGKIIRQDLSKLAARENENQQHLTINTTTAYTEQLPALLSGESIQSATSSFEWPNDETITQASSMTPSLATDSPTFSDNEKDEQQFLTPDHESTLVETFQSTQKVKDETETTKTAATREDELPGVLDLTHIAGMIQVYVTIQIECEFAYATTLLVRVEDEAGMIDWWWKHNVQQALFLNRAQDVMKADSLLNTIVLYLLQVPYKVSP
ncbi:putative NRPS-like protein biosynthetic cluster [Bacidia gigantensis]|uniref:putative NRPS-like protein biosynthetic cluster n=1 Tax=Bacidia gigantensis TaxID=2732470 RepID=UPI001D04351A|nr:putative NRPS-like protein biosynthetic cluster [Bacidia gigantensis]KAG8533018.1 putative NRPS-like protein biosynthetic cluster [Bacidia gigantensis]